MISDFGLSKIQAGNMLGVACGTPGYMGEQGTYSEAAWGWAGQGPWAAEGLGGCCPLLGLHGPKLVTVCLLHACHVWRLPVCLWPPDPELLEQKPHGKAVDVWALGAISCILRM